MRKKVLAATLTALGVILILVSTVNLFLIRANRTNYLYLRRASGAMEPTFSEGAVLKVEPRLNACEIHAAPKDANSPGDIIVFHSPRDPSELIVHRAVEKTIDSDGSCSFKTQGDNNPSPDGWTVTESDIVGKYTGAKAPLLGRIALFFEPLHVKVAFIMLWIIVLLILEVLPLSRKRVQEEQAQTKPS